MIGPMSVFYALPVAEALTLVMTLLMFLQKRPHWILRERQQSTSETV